MNVNGITPRVDLLSFATKNTSASKSKSTGINLNGPLATAEECDMVAKSADKYLEEISKTRELTIGVFGEGTYDLYYVPSGVIDNALQISGVGQKAPDWTNAYSQTSKCWNEFYKVLNENGINYKDPQSFKQFFEDDKLRSAIEAEYEQRIDRMI